MQFSTRTVSSSDGLELHVESWRADGDAGEHPKFVVVIAHGYSEHISRYERLAQVWTDAGGLVFGPDHRGQGRSAGPRGYTPSFETYARDLRTVIDAMRHELPPQLGPKAIPWFIFGHSMGGLITLTYLLEFSNGQDPEVPLRGVMLSAPLIDLAVEVPGWKRLAANVLSRLAPTVGLDSGLTGADVMRDPEGANLYDNDPRRAKVATPGWAKAMERAAERVKGAARNIELPMLWYVGTGDKVVDHGATLRLFETLKDPAANDQTVRKFDGYYHELHNEPADLRAPIEKLLADWVTERL